MNDIKDMTTHEFKHEYKHKKKRLLVKEVFPFYKSSDLNKISEP